MSSDTQRIVLVVDDEPDAVAFVTAVMEEAGHRVVSAGSSDECMARLKEITPDLIVLDVNMPGRPGFYALSDLKKDPATQSIPVIMLTGVSRQIGVDFSTSDLNDFLGCEPDVFLEKPIDPEYLTKVAGDLLARS